VARRADPEETGGTGAAVVFTLEGLVQAGEVGRISMASHPLRRHLLPQERPCFVSERHQVVWESKVNGHAASG
jgi:hypothetical protein